MAKGPGKNKTRKELAVENRMLRRSGRAIAVAGVLQTLIRWGGATAIAYFGYSSIAVLAGQYTFADIGIGFLASIKVSESVAWIFGVGGVVYGTRQSKLRKDTVERLSGRIQTLERQHDPGRSSSKLTPRGEEPGQ